MLEMYTADLGSEFLTCAKKKKKKKKYNKDDTLCPVYKIKPEN